MAENYVNGEIDPDVKDVLYEIGNVGVGTAIIPIGNLRQMEFFINTPNVFSMDQDIFHKIDYDPEQVVVGVITRMNDAFEGGIIFLLSKEFVRNTVHIMTEESYSDEELMTNEDSVSAIHEMINYMTAGYAKVIGSYLNAPVFISTASIGMDKAKNIVQSVLEHAGKGAGQIACVNTKFTVVDNKGKKTDETGQALIIPDQKSIEEFLKIMG